MAEVVPRGRLRWSGHVEQKGDDRLGVGLQGATRGGTEGYRQWHEER